MHYNLIEKGCKKLVEYFQIYWVDYVASLLDGDNLDEHLESPRMLLNDIISEIVYNKFKNNENVQYFKNELSKWYKNDTALKLISGTDIQNALKHHFHETHQKILLEICKKILADLDKYNYVDKLFDGLLEHLEHYQEITSETKEYVRIYTKLIIAEFVSKGYDLQDIKNYSYDIPGVIIVAGGEVISAPNTYLDIRKKQFSSEESYYKAVANRILLRNNAEILTNIKNRYYDKPIDAHIIMGLSYIKGVSEVNVGSVTIYSPMVRRFVKVSDGCSIEKESCYQNLCAAVPIKYVGLHGAIKQAKHKMDEVLEMLSIYYDKEDSIKYDLGEYYVVKDGNIIAESHSRAEKGMRNIDDFHIYAKAIHVDVLNNDQDDISALFQKLQSLSDETTKIRLKNALHWCRSANMAMTNEERLLHSWFALEGLLTVSEDVKACLTSSHFGKIEEIKSIVIAILGKSIFKEKCLAVYSEILWRLQNTPCLNIPEDIMEHAGLNIAVGDKYQFDRFVRCAEELSNNISDELLKDKLHKISQFYKSIDCYDNEIRRLMSNIQNMYRYRNLIVHNAIISVETTQYYTQMAYRICREVIGKLLKLCTDSNITIEQAILRLIIDYQCYYSNLPERIKHLWNVHEE